MTSPRQALPVTLAGCPGLQMDGQGDPVLLLAGPPMSAQLFGKAQHRLTRASVALELLHAPVRGDVRALAGVVEQAAAELGASAVVAHGLAVPVARATRGLDVIVLNGPLGEVDTVTSLLARLGPGVLSNVVLRRPVLDRWLSSSLGLRRLVANPYAMDRDIVVALSRPMTEDRQVATRAAEWIVDAAQAATSVGRENQVIAAIWGDHDPLYPLASVARHVARERIQAVPGGRHLFPEERPWELADRLDDVLRG